MNAPSLDQRLLEIASRSDQCALLSKVLLITREMHHAAVAGDWDVVTEHEATRRDWIQACFEEPVVPEHAHLFSEALAVMLHLNEEVMAKLQDARAAASAKHAGQVHVRKSVGHYLDVSNETNTDL